MPIQPQQSRPVCSRSLLFACKAPDGLMLTAAHFAGSTSGRATTKTCSFCRQHARAHRLHVKSPHVCSRSLNLSCKAPEGLILTAAHFARGSSGRSTWKMCSFCRQQTRTLRSHVDVGANEAMDVDVPDEEEFYPGQSTNSVLIPTALQPLRPGRDISHALSVCATPCIKCHALHFIEERGEGTMPGGGNSSLRNPLFTSCCGNGAFHLPLRPQPEYELQSLLEDQSSREYSMRAFR